MIHVVDQDMEEKCHEKAMFDKTWTREVSYGFQSTQLFMIDTPFKDKNIYQRITKMSLSRYDIKNH